MCFGPFVPWNMGTALHFGRDLAIIALPLWWSHLKPRNYALLATAAKRRSRFANASLNNPSSSSRILFILLENEMCFKQTKTFFCSFHMAMSLNQTLPKRNEFIYKRRIITEGNLNIERNNSVNLIQIPGIVCILLHSSRSFPPSWDGWFRGNHPTPRKMWLTRWGRTWGILKHKI